MRGNGYVARLQALSLALLLLLGVLMAGAPARAQQEEIEPQADRKIDFSVLAVMGDSLSQAYHNGVLHVDVQGRSYVHLLADRLGTPIRSALVAEPGGFGTRFVFRDPNVPVMPRNTATFLNLTLMNVNGQRIDNSVRVNNLSIGGAKVNDILTERPDPMRPNDSVYASLGLPWLFDNPPVVRSQIEFVETMNPRPTAVILLIGGNDALGAAFSSNLDQLTPVADFTRDYEEIVRRTKATGAQMILATVPDVPLVAAFVPGSDLPFITRVEQTLLTRLTGINADDFVTLRALPAIVDVLMGRRPGPVEENLILRKAQAATISKTIKKYNKAIFKIGKREKFPVVDLNDLLKQAAAPNGFEIPGVARISNKYFGGVASLDGVHLSLTGNAVLANSFIATINKFYKMNIALIDVTQIAKDDPDVPKMGTEAQQRLMPQPTLADLERNRAVFEALGEAQMRMFVKQ